MKGRGRLALASALIEVTGCLAIEFEKGQIRRSAGDGSFLVSTIVGITRRNAMRGRRAIGFEKCQIYKGPGPARFSVELYRIRAVLKTMSNFVICHPPPGGSEGWSGLSSFSGTRGLGRFRPGSGG